MVSTIKQTLCALMIVVIVGSQYALALPTDRTIIYEIHETPSDPKTTVAWTVELELKAADSTSADDIGWEIQVIRITDEGAQAEWCEVNPYENGGDNLWWLSHADGNNPTVEEFTEPPLIQGTATNATNDLDYDFEGTVYTPPAPPQQPPYPVTSLLCYTFHIVGEPDPEADEDDEPADTNDDAGNP
ncbi:MAG: hypothetical protein MI923_16140 [Phycisphaerales bacterium]|nr:hypothetical protein [Phycisphaerales bacterium]